MAKQTRITIETDSLLIVQSRISKRAWCPQCGAERDVIALAHVGVFSNLERLELQKWLSSGDLHRWQTTDGLELLCLDSLLARVQHTKTS